MRATKTHVLGFFLVLATGASAQQAPAPGLQQRQTNPADERPEVVLRHDAKMALPEEASGLYRFGNEIAEGIQIDEQFGEVTGYLTIKGTSGKGSLQSYFFSKVEGGGGELAFTTKAVHGISYSFEGRLSRGAGASRAQDGFYLMSGELMMHDNTSNVSQRRTISLKQTGLH